MSPTFLKIQPSLPVTSIPASITYYTQTLGFRVVGRDRDDHTWLRLPTDEKEDKYKAAVNLYLRRRGFPGIENDVQFGKVHISISGDEEDELERLLERFEKAGARITKRIERRPWGLKDFEVRDPDGNILSFDQAIVGWKPKDISGSGDSVEGDAVGLQ